MSKYAEARFFRTWTSFCTLGELTKGQERIWLGRILMGDSLDGLWKGAKDKAIEKHKFFVWKPLKY